jgi:hypothetical protein
MLFAFILYSLKKIRTTQCKQSVCVRFHLLQLYLLVSQYHSPHRHPFYIFPLALVLNKINSTSKKNVVWIRLVPPNTVDCDSEHTWRIPFLVVVVYIRRWTPISPKSHNTQKRGASREALRPRNKPKTLPSPHHTCKENTNDTCRNSCHVMRL